MVCIPPFIGYLFRVYNFLVPLFGCKFRENSRTFLTGVNIFTVKSCPLFNALCDAITHSKYLLLVEDQHDLYVIRFPTDLSAMLF